MGGSLDPRGPVAAEIAGLWWLMLWTGLAVFVVFGTVLAVGLLRRWGHDGPSWDRNVAGRMIVGLGVIMPAVVLLVVFGATLVSMRAMPHTASADALVVDVTARQFSWEVRYPGHDVVLTDELRIPVGRQVALRLHSTDVIHSFWVPQLAGKLDAMPGRVNTLLLQADEPGRYRGMCAEFCGLGHAHHNFVTVAQPPEAFAAWLESAR